jgi:hypothetical protein
MMKMTARGDVRLKIRFGSVCMGQGWNSTRHTSNSNDNPNGMMEGTRIVLKGLELLFASFVPSATYFLSAKPGAPK